MQTQDVKAQDARAQDARAAIMPYLNRRGPIHYTQLEINKAQIWNFAEAIEDGNPMYWDEDFARRSRFGRLISPPQMTLAWSLGCWWVKHNIWWAPDYVLERFQRDLDTQGEDPYAKVNEILDAKGYPFDVGVEREEEFLAPYGPGDGRMIAHRTVVDISQEKSARVGRGFFISTVVEYRVERNETLVGRSKHVMLKYRAHDK